MSTWPRDPNCPVMPLRPAPVHIEIVNVRRRFWWPHRYAEGLLWRTVVIGYRYFVDGIETDLQGRPVAHG